MPTALAKIVERTVGLPPTAPSVSPVADKRGYVKVRLTYLTPEPKHYRSYQLAIMYGLRGPFSEEIHVLMPQKEVTDLKPISFLSAFSYLQKQGLISRKSRLTKVALLDEDVSTLAYVCN